MHEHSHGHAHGRHAEGRHTEGQHVEFESPEMAAKLELEAEVLLGLMDAATAKVADLCGAQGTDVRRVLDLGCGPGVGTCSLAQRFGSATVVALDGSASMLARVAERARDLGLAERVQTHQVSLPAGLDALGELDPFDVAWASMVLHHIGDEVAVLRRIRELLVPGGLLAVVERAGSVQVVPGGDDQGRPGIWERLDAATNRWFADIRAELPDATPSADYPAMLTEAGFDVVTDEVLFLVLDAPLDTPAREFARSHLRSTHERLATDADVDAADLAVLDALIDEHQADDIGARDDTRITASRLLYVTRRP